MSLRDGAQVLVQRERPDGSIACAAFRGLAAVNSSLILIANAGGAQSAADADALYRAVLQEVGSLNPGVQSMQAPCGGGLGDTLGCHAHKEPSCLKLLVLVGDGTAPVAEIPTHTPWLKGKPPYTVLPVFPSSAKKGIKSLLPEKLQEVDVDFWLRSVKEAIPSILSLSGLTSDNSRIFISYRQKEASALAVQIFHALAEKNFDVFLDYFRISPGVNFQIRLTQELGQKSMLLVLETKGILDSEWTDYEIGTAKRCALGIVALHLPAGKEVPGVDEALRLRVKGSDFKRGVFTPLATLGKDALATVIERVESEHDRALVRRRWLLRDSLDHALDGFGMRGHQFDEKGILHMQAPNGLEYRVWLTPRPPDLVDFHLTYQNSQPPVRGVVIGLSRLMEPSGMLRTTWLAGLCQLVLVDEGKLVDAAYLMSRGAL